MQQLHTPCEAGGALGRIGTCAAGAANIVAQATYKFVDIAYEFFAGPGEIRVYMYLRFF